MERIELIEKLKSQGRYSFDDLCDVMMLLRSEGGCPWDMEQTHKSLRKDFIEETYEAIEAIDLEDTELLREELGDVLLQVVFHARIEEEQQNFNMGDVITELVTKLIHRHPHVFGEVKVDNSAEVLSNWDKIKNDEKQRVTFTSRLKSVPVCLPALMRAQKVGKRANIFDFPDARSVIEKIKEELAEVEEVLDSKEQVKEEIGDLLLAVTSLARKCEIDSEEALTGATEKFISRFEELEAELEKTGRTFENTNLDELDAIWDQIKAKKQQNIQKIFPKPLEIG